MLVFQVCDTGIGISPEAQLNIFEPFFQGDSSTKRRFGGSGLGLAISKHLSTLMQGELSFDSQLGRGTTFTLKLPLVVGPCIAPARPAPTFTQEMTPTVIVIDPNQAMRQVLQRKLSAAGYTVISCQCASYALAHVGLNIPSRRMVILVDMKEAAALDKLEKSNLCCTVVRMSYDQLPKEGWFLRKPVRDAVLFRLVEEAAKRLPNTCYLAPPVPQRAPCRRSPNPLRPPPAAPRSIKILVAEDNASNQLIIRRYLVRFSS
jgi:hypothetical protein